MGGFNGFERIIESIRAGGTLEPWHSNSGITLMEFIEAILCRDGKSSRRITNQNGFSGLETFIFYEGDPLKVLIKEDEYLGIYVKTLYPVSTKHLTRIDVDIMLQGINTQCEIGTVIYNEALQLLIYEFMFDLRESEPEGVDINMLLYITYAAIYQILDCLYDVREHY